MSVATPPRQLTVAVIGNPNTGKSTLFTALTGIHSQTGNYPGVTVEKKIGRFQHEGCSVTLVDLPGTYSLSPRSLDEMVSVDVLLGRRRDVADIDAVLCIVDASNLERNLYVVSQVLDLGLPVVLVLNMWDVAQHRGVQIDAAELSRRLQLPVVPCEAHRHRQIDEVRSALLRVRDQPVAPPRAFPPAFYESAQQLAEALRQWGEADFPIPLAERLLLDQRGQIEQDLTARYPKQLPALLTTLREGLATSGFRIPAAEAKLRYAWVRKLLDGAVAAPKARQVTGSDRLDRFLTHKFWGFAAFSLIMFLIFQAISTGAAPLMELCETVQGFIAEAVGGRLAPGPLRSLIVDGVIAGVGGVLIFLPQIILLFFFIALLEDCGYMARAAFVMDKLMSKIGLSGKSFVPLMSSFACAIPGIMATRTIENRRDRFVTILVAPLMSCSARAPVYLLMITAFVPPLAWAGGWVTLQGLMLLVMTSLGAFVAIPVAWVLKRTFFHGETPPFVMELPSYKWPSPRIVIQRVWDSAWAFVARAGTLILATNILIWAACYFPEDHAEEERLAAAVDEAQAAKAPELEELVAQHHAESERLLEHSYLGRVGKTLEPVFIPLGWDWRIGVGVLASFPAREVIVATLGTIYSLGSDVEAEHEGLHDALKSARWPDGRPVYTLAVALSVMVFFALCAQCSSTLMIIRRETNSWFWPAFTFVYMTGLAYVAALATFQTARMLSS
ncbi:MAG: ferrous iron transport protein B [Planctomycetaceae bacterium]